MNANLPSREIESRLKIVRGRIRAAQLRRAAWVTATIALAGLLLIMAADYFFAPLPLAARWVFFGAWLIAVGFALKTTAAPLLQKITLIRIARWIEARHPEMEERLSTVLELSRNDSGVSPELLEALGKAAGEDIAHVDPKGEVKSAQKKRRWGKPAAALAAILVLALVVWPREASRLLVRAVAPFSNIGNAGAVKFNIQPGDLEVLEGDKIRIEIGYEGTASSIDLILKMDGQKDLSQPLAKEGDHFFYTLDPARESFTYRAQAGRAQSDEFTATVWPLPAVVDPLVTLGYPAYTGLLEHEQPLGEGIEAVEGTTVMLKGGLNTPVDAGWIEINGKRAAEAKVEMSASGSRVGFEWKLSSDATGEAVVKFRHRLGREIEALKFAVGVLPDQPPQVAIITPSQKQLKVRPDELLNIQYEVIEDFALARSAIEVNAGGNRSATLVQTLPFPIKGTRPPRFDGSADVSIGQLRSRFPGVNELKLRVRAEDARPADLGGPGIGHSEWLVLRIDQNAESLARQALRAEHDEARETIEKAIQEARQAKDQMDSLRDEVKKEAMHENSVKRLEQSTEKLAAAEEKLTRLAQEMENGIHAAKADEVAKAAENLGQSREALQNAPLQDKPESREQQLNAAKQNAEEAVRQLEEVRNQMDRDREKIQDLARVQELAQQQQELARQAAENLESPPPSQQARQEWQNQQRQVMEQIKQQLRERPDARAETLKQQAQQAKAMAEEARRMADAQKNLQQQAQQATQPDQAAAMKEELQQALAKEQAKIAAEAKEQLAEAQKKRTEAADRLPKATAAADQALQQLQQGEPQAAADSAKQAAEAMKEAGGESSPTETAKADSPADQPASPEKPPSPEQAAQGDFPPESQTSGAAQAEALGELSERQQQIAGAMEALAKGDLNAALQGLQDAQAEAAENLAEEIKGTPLVDNTGHMNEATNNAQQGSQQAQAAGKQGEAGQQQQAAQQHEQAAGNFQKSAEALERAAQEFSQQAEQTATQQQNPNKAQLPANELAEAFQQAGETATAKGAEAAQAAADAAAALNQAAQAGRSQMQGQPQPAPPAQPGMARQRGQQQPPGEKAPEGMDGLQQRSADPGVPPELAKLGISAADWEKIQANLASDVGAGGADAIPEEYRGLVKGYFESMSKKKD